jgi:hypothetical protein
MRAIIINAQDRTITETEIDGSLKSLHQIVGGFIEAVYHGLDDSHHCYVNEEGLLLKQPQHFFMFQDGHQPLAGNGVILASTDDGDEAPCTLPLDWVKERVTYGLPKRPALGPLSLNHTTVVVTRPLQGSFHSNNRRKR